MPHRFPRVAHGLLAGVALVAAACGSATSNESPQALLADAKHSVDSAQTIHFSLSSSDTQASGTYLIGGEGDAQRPDGFAGTLNVSISGLLIKVHVASVGGTFYVQLPYQSSWSVAQPDKYGFGDPAKLIDPDSGLSSLLTKAKSPSGPTQDRYNGELLDEISCSLPGADVARLLTSADPSKDDKATFGIDDQTHQLRRVVITGPFFSTSQNSTYTLILDKYGENISVTPPPT